MRDELVRTPRRRSVPDRSSSTWRRSPRSARPSSGSSRPSRGSTRSSTTRAPSSRPGRSRPTGIEATLATMVVGPFALVAGLLPLLEATRGARVIAVTSRRAVRPAPPPRRPPVDVRAVGRDAGVRPSQAGAGHPDAGVGAADRREPGSTFVAMHPGWADTPGIAAALPGFHRLMGPLLRTPGRGRRHDGLACRRPGRNRPRGPAGAGSPRPPVRPDPVDARLAGRSPSAVGRRSSASPGSPTRCPDHHLIGARHDPHPRAPDTDLPIEATFDFVADFANAAAWDPGTAWSRRTRARRRAARGRHHLRARRPDGRPGRPDDLPDHATSSARRGSSSSAPAPASTSVDDIRFAARAATGPPSTTPRTSGSGASGGWSSRSSAARSRGSAGMRRRAWRPRSPALAGSADRSGAAR